ncbi:MAG: hypothetical protein AVDCRST_MAG93-8163, partial [uncultured Chloroflexia bacterium]
HLLYTRDGFVSVLLQIKDEQSAYVVQVGCAGCAVDRCGPGCRVALFRRILAVGYPRSQLVPVKNGLSERPYTRTIVAWPAGDDAEALDQSVLAGWTDARLQVHWRSTEWYQSLRWRSTGHPKPQLAASALLRVGDGGDDPLERLRDRGWKAHHVSEALPCLGGQPRLAPFWARRRTTLDPHLLTSITPTSKRLLRPPGRPGTHPLSDVDTGLVTSYGNASTIVQHLEEAGARSELLDLDRDHWTAQVVATTTTGGDARPIFETLLSPGSPLTVRDADSGTVALEPASVRSAEASSLLVYLGTRPDGRHRWRPLSATHHLVLAGAIEAGTIAGMLAPAVHGRPDLRVGVLDLTTEGVFNLALQDLPGRLPTTDEHSCSELLGVIGGLPDHEQPIVIVLHADDVEHTQTALVALLRAAMYRPISVLLVVPDSAAIPALIQDRCPLVVVREHVARMQALEGNWEWVNPTVLRLPWRAPDQVWVPRSQQKRPSEQLLPREGFWVVSHELGRLLNVAQEVEDDTMPDAAQIRTPDEEPTVPTEVVPPAMPDAEQIGSVPSSDADAVPQPEAAPEQTIGRPKRPANRCRVYDSVTLPVRSAPQSVVSTTLPAPTTPEPIGDAAPSVQTPEGSAPSLPDTITGHVLAPNTATLSTGVAQPSSALVSTTDPVRASIAYTPREDDRGNLVVDDQLLVLTLQWAEQLGEDAQGVPITRFRRALDLPTKAHSYQLRDALEQRGLIRREVRDGWYRLVTIRDAVLSGKLPPGPWYVPSAPDDHAEAPAPPAPSSGEGPSGPSVEGNMYPNGANGASVSVALDQSVP